MADHGEHGAYSEVFEEDGKDVKPSRTIHRIRANSSVMRVNKLLGEYSCVAHCIAGFLGLGIWC